MEAGLAVEGRVGKFGAHGTGREAGQRQVAAGGQGTVEEAEVADPAVGRQVVEAPRVVDEVVGACQFDRGRGEGVAAVEPDVGPGLTCPVLCPRDGCCGEVDGVHVESPGRQIQGVATRAATQVESSARGDQPPGEPGDQALVRLGHEERDRFGAVGVEAVPPVAPAGCCPAVGIRSEQAVEESQYVLDRAYVPVHPAPSHVEEIVWLGGIKAQVRRHE